MELVILMDMLRDNWPLILVLVVIALVVAVILLRPRQRVRLSDDGPVRPHMAVPQRPQEGWR